MPGHGDDPFGAELFGGEHTHQADGTVTDHGHGLAGSGLGGDGGEPARPEDVGSGQQRGNQVLVRLTGRGDQRAVG